MNDCVCIAWAQRLTHPLEIVCTASHFGIDFPRGVRVMDRPVANAAAKQKISCAA